MVNVVHALCDPPSDSTLQQDHRLVGWLWATLPSDVVAATVASTTSLIASLKLL